METKKVTYLRVYFVRSKNHECICNFDRKDAGELFDLLIKLEKHNKSYRIDVRQERMIVPKEGGMLCMK